ncbi:MAG: 16S rRNA (guanine(966)-N(2))-methyltransferase RsmD [Rhodospirillales bacterium]|nr:MAG: 16S rRNA (guanine(966)-N(2))-methyltransferase RsmD [Rhodospirillales bacterium]
MRIVAGSLKGRLLLAPPGRLTRPTASRARETLFNLLIHANFEAPGLEGARVLDAFAGAGTLGFEALSRGATHVTFMENWRGAAKTIENNAKRMGVEDRVRVLAVDATRAPAVTVPVDIALLDPPYGEGLIPLALASLWRQGWLRQDSLVVAEVAAKEDFTPPEGFMIRCERTAGSAARFLFLGRARGA